MLQAKQISNNQKVWAAPLPEAAAMIEAPAWAPGSTHVAAAFQTGPPAGGQGHQTQLLILRHEDQASRCCWGAWPDERSSMPAMLPRSSSCVLHRLLRPLACRPHSTHMRVLACRLYATERLTASSPPARMELHWAPCLSPDGRARLAVISKSPAGQVGLSRPPAGHSAAPASGPAKHFGVPGARPGCQLWWAAAGHS